MFIGNGAYYDCEKCSAQAQYMDKGIRLCADCHDNPEIPIIEKSIAFTVLEPNGPSDITAIRFHDRTPYDEYIPINLYRLLGFLNSSQKKFLGEFFELYKEESQFVCSTLSTKWTVPLDDIRNQVETILKE